MCDTTLTRGFCVDTRPLPARSNKAPGSGRGRCALLLRPRFPRTRAGIWPSRGRAWRPGTPRAGSETETGWAARAAVRNSPIPRATAAGRRRSPQFERKAAPLDRWPDGRASFRTQPTPAARNHVARLARAPPFSFLNCEHASYQAADAGKSIAKPQKQPRTERRARDTFSAFFFNFVHGLEIWASSRRSGQVSAGACIDRACPAREVAGAHRVAACRAGSRHPGVFLPPLPYYHYGSSSPLTGVAGSRRPDSQSIGLSSVSRSRITASQDQRSA